MVQACDWNCAGFWRIGLIAVLVGCQRGPEMGKVTGKITFNGVPVEHGTVLLFPERGPAAMGRLDQQGEFLMRTNGQSGVFIGLSQVAIIPPTDLAVIGTPKYPGAPPNVRFDNIPHRFHTADTSHLRFGVKPGDNRLELDLAMPANP